MIYDTLEHRSIYAPMGERIAKALDYLAETDFSKLEDGRYDIDGDNLFVKIFTSDTKPVSTKTESHKKYLDVQFLIDGVEEIGVAPLEEMAEEVDANPEKDVWHQTGTKLDHVTIGNGKFLIVWPNDAHAPGISVNGEPYSVRKACVKIKID